MSANKKFFSLAMVTIIISAFSLASVYYFKFKQKLYQAVTLTQALQRTSQSVNSNLKNVTDELRRSKDELKIAQEKLREVEKNQVLPLQAKIDELNKLNEEKEIKALGLSQDYAKLNKDYLDLKANQMALEKKISDLSTEKKEIRSKLEEGQVQSPNDAALGGKNKEKLNQKARINTELVVLRKEKNNLENKIIQQNKTIDKLNSDNSILQGELNKISLKLNSRNSDFNVRQKEANKLKSEITQLQTNVDNLERELFNAHVEQVEKNSTIEVLNIQKENLEKETKRRKVVRESTDKIKKMQKEKLAVQLRLSSSELELARKNETIAALENNIDLLNKQLLQKEQQKKALEAVIDQNNNLKGSSQKQLAQQQAQIAELNLLNEDLKLKLSEFSATLTNKEFELEKSNNKVALLEKEAYDLEMQLKEAKRMPEVKNDREPKSSSLTKDNTEAMKRKLDEILKQ